MKRTRTRNSLMLITLTLILALFVTACSSASKSASQDLAKNEMPRVETFSPDANMGESYKEEVLVKRPAEGGEGTGELKNYDQKLIRNVSMEIRSVNVDQTYDEIRATMIRHQAVETNLNSRTSENYQVISVEYKVPSEQVDALLAALKGEVKIANLKITSNDVTEQYYDVLTRVETKEKTLEQYYLLLKDAHKMEDILTVQREIDNLTAEIETLKGKRNLWDHQVAMSVVSIEILEEADPTVMKREVSWDTLSWDDVVYLIKSGWNTVVASLVRVLQWAGIILAVALPVLIPLGLILFFVIRMILRKVEKKKKRQLEQYAAYTYPVQPVATDSLQTHSQEVAQESSSQGIDPTE